MFSGNDATTMQNILQNDLGSYAQAAVDAGAFSTASGLQTILEIQRGWILNQGVGFSENFDYSFGELLDHHGDGFPANVRKGNTLGYDSWYLLPFGRGSVKITGNDPTRLPASPSTLATSAPSLTPSRRVPQHASPGLSLPPRLSVTTSRARASPEGRWGTARASRRGRPGPRTTIGRTGTRSARRL
jgi:hypothetical protein